LKIETSIISIVVIVVKGCSSGYAGEDVRAFGKAIDDLTNLTDTTKTKHIQFINIFIIGIRLVQGLV